ALGEVLRAAFQISLDDPAEIAGERLQAGATATLEGLGLDPDELAVTVYALATTAGIPLANNPLDHLEPRAVADELARAWPRFASALAARSPTVLVIEDLHWAGEPLVEMLDRLIESCEGPLLLLATARPEFAAAGPAFSAVREHMNSISLQPLNEHEGAALILGLLGTADLGHTLSEEILRTADGNPFYLEELVLRLIDSKAIVQEDNAWRVTQQAHGLALPDSIQALLAARIDSLPPEEKSVLQEASVVGRVF